MSLGFLYVPKGLKTGIPLPSYIEAGLGEIFVTALPNAMLLENVRGL